MHVFALEMRVYFEGINFRGWTITKDFADFIFVVCLLAHAHINMQLYLHTVSLESIILNTPTIINFRGTG